ncbi:hypothetical protein WA158_002051 [Blastocystis sp. Blastoise]
MDYESIFSQLGETTKSMLPEPTEELVPLTILREVLNLTADSLHEEFERICSILFTELKKNNGITLNTAIFIPYLLYRYIRNDILEQENPSLSEIIDWYSKYEHNETYIAPSITPKNSQTVYNTIDMTKGSFSGLPLPTDQVNNEALSLSSIYKSSKSSFYINIASLLCAIKKILHPKEENNIFPVLPISYLWLPSHILNEIISGLRILINYHQDMDTIYTCVNTIKDLAIATANDTLLFNLLFISTL